MTCKHRWKLYTGLKEQFEYCDRCDIRKDKAIKPTNPFSDDIIYGPMFGIDNLDDTTEEIELPIGSGQQFKDICRELADIWRPV